MDPSRLPVKRKAEPSSKENSDGEQEDSESENDEVSLPDDNLDVKFYSSSSKTESSDDGSVTESPILSEDLCWESEDEVVVGRKQNVELPGTKGIWRVSDKNDEDSFDEYDEDSSDEEDIRNTVGNIPINWYDDYPHIGYDWDGRKILKSKQGDQLDYFLKKMEDPNFWRTVIDPQTGQDVVLSDKDVDLIKRLESQKIPDETFDEYAPWIEWFTSEVMTMPLRKFPEHKRSFVPSKDEMKRVSRYLYSLKMGWMKTKKAIKAKEKQMAVKGPQFYMLWETDDAAEEMRRIHNHIPAPKRRLPDHSESYNPPEEYLFNVKEQKKWDREKRSLGNKKLHFVPQKYNSLREVPAYKRFMRERFLRCLDLYMCPRAVKMKLTIEPEDLVPQLPSPMDLQPFPTDMSLVYSGHSDMVRSISVDPSGQYLASASDDQTVKLWEISTARCLKTIEFDAMCRCVAWSPNKALPLVAVAVEKRLIFLNVYLGDSLISSRTDKLLDGPPFQDKFSPTRVRTAVHWEYITSGDLFDKGVRVIVNHFKEIKQIGWHKRGDYIFSLMPEGENRSVIVQQLTKGRSHFPFPKARGLVQAALFHPYKTWFIAATQRNIRIYDLVKQEMIRKLITNSKWISHMAIHPGGDNLLVGTYDRKVLWFDLDLSPQPYKTLALHTQAVRSVAFHKRYPLFASTSDDESVIISHGMVYNDLLKNALIVPLKRFSCHTKVNDYSLFDVEFHPFQPWVFTSGADSTIRLYS